MKFYKISAISPVPNAGLRHESRGDVLVGNRMVRDIVPGCYSLEVWDSGRKWPDLLHSLDCMLWSGRVVAACQEAELRGIDFYPQNITKIDSKVLRRIPEPHYHWAHASTGIPAMPGDLETYPEKEGGYIDKEAIDVSEVINYPMDLQTGFYDLSKKAGLCLWNFDFSHWQGADLFYISTVHTRHRYCTQRFKDLVESHEFTNFRFTGSLNPEGNWFFA